MTVISNLTSVSLLRLTSVTLTVGSDFVSSAWDKDKGAGELRQHLHHTPQSESRWQRCSTHSPWKLLECKKKKVEKKKVSKLWTYVSPSMRQGLSICRIHTRICWSFYDRTAVFVLFCFPFEICSRGRTDVWVSCDLVLDVSWEKFKGGSLVYKQNHL